VKQKNRMGMPAQSARWLPLVKLGIWLLVSLALSIVLGSVLAMLTACAPTWPGAGFESNDAIVASFEPLAAIDNVAPITRIRLRASAESIDIDGLLLVEGDVGQPTLRKLARGEPSAALRERTIAHVSWHAADGAIVLAPLTPLALGEIYSIASASPPWTQSFAVMETDPLATLALVWPPPGGAEAANLAVWCGDEPLVDPGETLTIGDGLAQRLAGGSDAMGWGAACVHLEVAEGAHQQEASTPPLLIDAENAPFARLTPRHLFADRDPTPLVPRTCDADSVVFGPGCAQVQDDRAIVRGPHTPLLWTLRVAAETRVLPLASDQAFTLTGLVPSAINVISLRVQDAAGEVHGVDVGLQSGPPQAHVVITEVLANPHGPEPQQEWVELYNDGSVAAQIGGWTLRDVGGEATLPPASLAPGAFALIVRDDYEASGKHDPAPADGTLLFRVPRLGKNGLSNTGEPLELVSDQGMLVSAFSGAIASKAGRSVMRVRPSAPDDNGSSFVLAVGDPTPGAMP
jgi:hypothetical protein